MLRRPKPRLQLRPLNGGEVPEMRGKTAGERRSVTVQRLILVLPAGCDETVSWSVVTEEE